MKPLLTSSPWGFRFFAPDDYFRTMKSLGIDELCLLGGEPGTFPLTLPGGAEGGKRFRDAMAAAGVSALEAAIPLDRPRDLESAAASGARYLRICEVWERDPESFRSVVRRIRELGERANDAGMRLIVENHGGLLADADDCLRFFDAAGTDRALLNFDGANFLAFAGQEPLAALRKLRGCIGFVHLKNVGADQKFSPLADGVIDYRPIVAELRTLGVPLAVEYEDPDNAARGTADDLAELRRLLAGNA